MLKAFSIIFVSVLGLSIASFGQDNNVTNNTQDAVNIKRKSNKIIGNIVGTWQISEVVDVRQKKDKNKPKVQADKMTTSSGFTIIELQRDGKYKTTNDAKAIDSGSYRLNENHGRLYLESATDRSRLFEYNVTLQNDMLTLQSDSSKNESHFRYIYERSK